MNRRILAAIAACGCGWIGAGVAAAQDQKRPDENDLFGAPAPGATAPEPPPSAPAPASRDDAILGNPGGATKLSDSAAPENPLQIGGLLYLRAQTFGQQDQAPQTWALSAPALADVYFDARPNDRVRGFLMGRMTFDPTLPAAGALPVAGGAAGAGGNSTGTAGAPTLSGLFAPRTRGPTVALDQMWLRFDILRTVFVTAGKQHARWGTARFWAPTDYLHQVKRNPLDPFDPRTGTTMLKLHLPWEARGWNFYAFAIPEQSAATPTVGDVAGAGRAEVVVGTAELGADAVVRRGRKPRIGFDLSMGLGDVDVYGDLGLRYGSEIQRVRYEPNPVLGTDANGTPYADAMQAFPNLDRAIDAYFPASYSPGIKPQAVGGLTYALKYNDNDVFTIGGEYFYNSLGYDTPQAYPGLILPRSVPLADPATFFYLGRYYAAVFAVWAAPGSWDNTTFTLSTLGNLSDQSMLTRLDYGLTVLTHMRFEAFAAVHYGRREGEFRLGVSNLSLGGAPAFSRAPSLIDLGVALRLAI